MMARPQNGRKADNFTLKSRFNLVDRMEANGLEVRATRSVLFPGEGRGPVRAARRRLDPGFRRGTAIARLGLILDRAILVAPDRALIVFGVASDDMMARLQYGRKARNFTLKSRF